MNRPEDTPETKRRLQLFAAIAAILAGVLFVGLPGSGDREWRLFVGAIWLVAGGLWLLAYRRGARGAAR